MASSLFKPALAKEQGVCTLYAYVDIGSTGACTLNAAKSKGIASIVRNSTGNYTITLAEGYNSLLFADFMYLESTSRDLTFQLLAEAVATSTAPTVQFVVHAAATATDPTSGGVVLARIVCKNSSI